MVCTRVLSLAGRGRLEVRLQVDLSPDEAVAYRQAAQVADEIKTAVHAALVGAEASVVCVDLDELDLPALPRGRR